MTQRFSTWGHSRHDRTPTPDFLPDDELIVETVVDHEGHYQFRANVREGWTEILFYHWHDKRFDPPVLVQERRPAHKNQIVEMFADKHAAINSFNAGARYYQRYLDRRELLPRDHNAWRATVRTRKSKAYKVYFRPYMDICENCPFSHMHRAELLVHGRNDKLAYKRTFECDEYEHAIQVYQDALKNIDTILMEDLL